ncbi:MAG: hypothetical protein FWH22_06180 [Fibromonadales bacterium]|nr:hypothetical protein [Fibromonadales bacterium]
MQSWLWTGAQVDQSYWFTEINCSTGGTSSSSSSVVPSSSSRQPSSSSSANTTPIITNRENPLIGIIGVQTIYYNLKGEPLGTQKPTTPGLYLVKNTKTGQIQKIIVR